MASDEAVKFIDLFAGIGGMREGFEQACAERALSARCVFTSEIKQSAIDVLKQNHPDEVVHGDITQINEDRIPAFDFLLAGFPCQAFSSAGKRLGFEDARGTLFFEVARIIKAKNPYGFILENVDGLANHDKENPGDEIGKTLSLIIRVLEDLGYKVSRKVLNAKFFGVAQERKRIYIVGTKKYKPDLEKFTQKKRVLADVLESGLPAADSPFIRLVLQHYPLSALYGKAIKDKRGGGNNIHSWDLEYKGPVSAEQALLLNTMLKERRKKKWAEDYGIDWMDGMPLTLDHIRTFCDSKNLEEMLTDLVEKGYLKKEHPKRKTGGRRVQDTSLPLGFNIVAGKKSFEISKILDPRDIAPTLVAMDMQHLFVVDNDGLRTLSLREGLRLFGYSENFRFNVTKEDGYDLLGNTVAVPVIKEVALRVLDIYSGEDRDNESFGAGRL